MSQFLTLIWLKWTLFRNSLRSKKAVASSIASTLGTLAALGFGLIAAVGLGIAAYGIANLNVRHGVPGNSISIDSFSFLFLIFAGVYLMWATIPLSLGGASQFDAGSLLLYPISLVKIFVVDFASELTSLGSIFAIPIVMAVALGSGLGRQNVVLSLVGGVFALLFGLALAKWLAISLGALTRKKRTRGETMLAAIGALLGIGGAFAGQLAPMLLEHEGLWQALHWSPVGVAVMAVVGAPHGVSIGDYLTALAFLSGYTLVLIAIAFWIARRSALKMGGSQSVRKQSVVRTEHLGGWRIPIVSAEIGAVLEKELKYAMRNAQLRMLGIMPLVLVGLKMVQTRGPMSGSTRSNAITVMSRSFGEYTTGLIPAFGILYMFLITSALACNSFAYDGNGMRLWILAPIERRSIIVGKNLNMVILAGIYSILFLGVNEIIFKDLTAGALLFVVLSFVLYATFFAHFGNWFSIKFPKKMRFGKRMNTAGVTGLFLLPMMVIMGAMIIGTAAVGYAANSVGVKYVTLAVLALLAGILYLAMLPSQGRALARHEHEILETVSGKDEE